MQMTSPAFADGAPIPAHYTCDGADVSPELRWTGVPPTAGSLALVVDDPDASGGEWVHWVVYDLPAHLSGLPQDVPKTQHIPPGGKQGLNDFRRLGYGGPCPPPGRPHRYRFKLFALDRMLDLRPGATRAELEGVMAPYVLGRAQWMGTYQH